MKTFSIGGVHPDDNKLSAACPIETLPLPERVYISMAQHLGAPAVPIVKPGDKVLTGQVIGEPSGFMSAYVHSSVTGVVSEVAPMPDLAGNKVMHVSIYVEPDRWAPGIDSTDAIIPDNIISPARAVEKIRNCGVVGLGGAAFPTNIKLTPPPGKKADILILNGTECEPYLTSDDRIMRERSEEIIRGAVIIMKILDVSRCLIGIEKNKPEAIDAMSYAASKTMSGVRIVPLKKKYPQGGEKQLIDALTGRRVPSGALPIDVGAVVQNVGTALAVYEAVQKGKPLIDNVVTVSGKCFPQARNFQVRVGTPISYILQAAGGLPQGDWKVISGGPMMGKAVSNLDAATLKATSSILVLGPDQTLRGEEGPCIRCGKCAEACPMGLEPFNLNRLAARRDMDSLEKFHVADCIECGCCLYTCPANIPLLDNIRLAKGDVMKIIRGRKK